MGGGTIPFLRFRLLWEDGLAVCEPAAPGKGLCGSSRERSPSHLTPEWALSSLRGPRP